MSDPDPTKPNPGMPDGIPAPPPPRPDLKDFRSEGPTYGPDKDSKKKKKKRNERTHPTDPYAPLKKRRGCGGCFGCLGASAAALILLVAAIIGGIVYFGPGRFVSKGYKVVNLDGDDAIVSTAPGEATFYIARGALHYNVTVTNVPVAIIARETTVEGDFLETVSITAAKVTVTQKSRFAKDLEVFAAEFQDLGMTLKGALTGRVIKNLP